MTDTRWQELVNSFGLQKPGTSSWDATRLERNFPIASHGEQCVIQFLLNLWDPREKWACGPFDVFDALATWEERPRQAFLAWASHPWWP